MLITNPSYIHGKAEIYKYNLLSCVGEKEVRVSGNMVLNDSMLVADQTK